MANRQCLGKFAHCLFSSRLIARARRITGTPKRPFSGQASVLELIRQAPSVWCRKCGYARRWWLLAPFGMQNCPTAAFCHSHWHRGQTTHTIPGLAIWFATPITVQPFSQDAVNTRAKNNNCPPVSLILLHTSTSILGHLPAQRNQLPQTGLGDNVWNRLTKNDDNV